MKTLHELDVSDLVASVRGYVYELTGILYRVSLNKTITEAQVRSVEHFCDSVKKHFRRALDE